MSKRLLHVLSQKGLAFFTSLITIYWLSPWLHPETLLTVVILKVVRYGELPPRVNITLDQSTQNQVGTNQPARMQMLLKVEVRGKTSSQYFFEFLYWTLLGLSAAAMNRFQISSIMGGEYLRSWFSRTHYIWVLPSLFNMCSCSQQLFVLIPKSAGETTGTGLHQREGSGGESLFEVFTNTLMEEEGGRHKFPNWPNTGFHLQK